MLLPHAWINHLQATFSKNLKAGKDATNPSERTIAGIAWPSVEIQSGFNFE
jgi:hypothetical protein